MRKITLLVAILALTGCTDVLDKPIGKENLLEVKEVILSDKARTKTKNKYIWDNLSTKVGFMVMSNAMGMDGENVVTFRTKIDEFSSDYDSIKKAKELIKVNNKKLESFVKLTDSETYGVTKYKGFLSLSLDFDNKFDKEVLYVILNYKYVNKYDTEYFNEKVKVSDEITDNFKNDSKITLTEKYNDVVDFMYSKVPLENTKEFLMEGMKIETLKIVFKDKSSIEKLNGEWKYFE